LFGQLDESVAAVAERHAPAPAEHVVVVIEELGLYFPAIQSFHKFSSTPDVTDHDGSGVTTVREGGG
jgi:hypothetical protein